MGRHDLVVLAGLLALSILPPFLTDYLERVITSALLLASLALAQNILLGYTGYPAFGSVAFFGVGGYVTAVLMKDLSLPFPLALLCGTLFSGLLALLIAPPVMRLKSHYFAITTLALQLALGELVANLEVTGGAQGINLPIYRGPGGYLIFYYLFWTLTLVAFLINAYVERSTFGYALKAIREDEVAAETLGVNTLLFKTASFTLMALITGCSGGIYAYWITYIDPTSMFDPVLSVKMFVALLMGGVGTVGGPVAGAFVLEVVSETLWGQFPRVHGLILGLLIVLIVLIIPKGIWRRR
ncbi:MAG: branched-chain amino acid ABC transporter permease [Aquificota bacterium]|nr:branched-chain amino acid ABC transporter permease [Aquificota bacterium]